MLVAEFHPIRLLALVLAFATAVSRDGLGDGKASGRI